MDTFIAVLLSFVAAVSSMVVLWRCDQAINRMGWKTHGLVRYAFLLLIAGALFELSGILFFGRPPHYAETVFLVGTAMLLVCERRIRYLARQPARRKAAPCPCNGVHP